MNKKQWRERLDTISCFISEAQHAGSMCSVQDIEQFCDLLHRYETTLHRILEIQCSVEMSEKEEKRLSDKEERIEKRVKDIVDLLKFKVQFNGDPRGGAIRFVLPSGRSNGWDQETWEIYW